MSGKKARTSKTLLVNGSALLIAMVAILTEATAHPIISENPWAILIISMGLAGINAYLRMVTEQPITGV